jgi:Fic family protein
MNKIFESIDAAKAEWGALLPLSPENDRRFWQKLRLEWNYHSNHIEGNTLTYGETELLLIHGQTHGNHNVLTATGELFEFAAPADVPARMQALVKWLEESLHEFRQANLLWLLAKLHHEFVLIHPFDDGNGRVARMLVNYVLIRLDYPPIIVPTERKKDYLVALRLADAGDIMELEKFLGECVVRSLELGIKASKGESLDEPGDVEKEIKLFIRSQEQHKDKVKPPSTELIRGLFETSFKCIFSKLSERMKVFEELFVKSSMSIEPKTPNSNGDIIVVFDQFLTKGFKMDQRFVMRFNYDGFRGEAPKPFGVGAVVELRFDKFEYVWTIGSREFFRKLYTEVMLTEEIDQFVEAVQSDIFKDIKKKAKKTDR